MTKAASTRARKATPKPREQQRQRPVRRPTSTAREERATGPAAAPSAAPAPLYDDVVRQLGFDPMPGTS